jgi:hypothetical protein
MTAPVKLNLKIYQGATFRETLRWEGGTKVYRPITAVAQSAPTSITADGHGLPIGWRFRVANVLGMTEINSPEGAFYIAQPTDFNTILVQNTNSLGFKPYTSGGVVEYQEPVDLSGVTARMQIREKLDSDTVLLELTTENSRIVIDNLEKTIKLYISDTDTAAMNFSSAVYSLELVKSGDVIPFVGGSVSLVREVTR